MPNLEPQRYRLRETFRSLLRTHKLTVREFAEQCELTEQSLTNALYNSDRGRGVVQDKAQRIAHGVATLEDISFEAALAQVFEALPRIDRKTIPPPIPHGPDQLLPLNTCEPEQTIDEQRYYTPHATAQALGVHHRSVLKYLKDDQRETHIQGEFYAGRWFISGKELQRQRALRQAKR